MEVTGFTARNIRLAGRGTLKVGHHADITVFDAGTVRDAASYESPTLPAEGIDTVIVKGAITWQHDEHSGARGGQIQCTLDYLRALMVLRPGRAGTEG